jgi:hypothetical protein
VKLLFCIIKYKKKTHHIMETCVWGDLWGWDQWNMW